jgi:polyferredoxin
MAEVILLPRRQAVRKAAIFAMFLLFPVVLNYFSPYVIVDGAGQGIINGSFVVFAGMFVSAVFVGRLWCAWACPAAGLQEACFAANGKPARGGRFDWIKWGIWIPWIGIIAFAAISAGGYRAVNLLHLTESGISVDEPLKYITYYSVVGTIFLLSLIAGRRAFCHYGCWMAPFMILRRKVRNVLNTPALRLQADTPRCGQCKTCTRGCPMSLAVDRMVQAGAMENSECILCGTCIDNCPKHVISYSFSSGQG